MAKFMKPSRSVEILNWLFVQRNLAQVNSIESATNPNHRFEPHRWVNMLYNKKVAGIVYDRIDGIGQYEDEYDGDGELVLRPERVGH